jgi:hypothetical protein
MASFMLRHMIERDLLIPALVSALSDLAPVPRNRGCFAAQMEVGDERDTGSLSSENVRLYQLFWNPQPSRWSGIILADGVLGAGRNRNPFVSVRPGSMRK